MQDINVAVLGARASGKSTFIRHALNLPNQPSTQVCTRRMTIDGRLYLVRFLEISIHDVHLRDQNAIKWPDSLDDLPTPRIDGAVTIYDVTSEQSLARVPEILGQHLLLFYLTLTYIITHAKPVSQVSYPDPAFPSCWLVANVTTTPPIARSILQLSRKRPKLSWAK